MKVIKKGIFSEFFVSGDGIQKIFFDQKEIKRWHYTATVKLIL